MEIEELETKLVEDHGLSFQQIGIVNGPFKF